MNEPAKLGESLLDAARNGHTDTVKELVSAGADAQKAGGFSALMSAAFFGHADAALQLMHSGANVNARDAAGYTALRYAARKGRADTVKALVDAGADVNTSENSALRCAIAGRNAECVRLSAQAQT